MSLKRQFSRIFRRKSTPSGRPLFEAAVVGDLTKVRRLSGSDVTLEHCNVDGYTPLHAAVQMGHLEVVEYLIEKGGDVNTRNRKGQTCLSSAAHRGHHLVVNTLIANGAELNARCEARGWSPLGYSVRNGHEKVVDILINAGADFQIKDGDQSPLNAAAQCGHVEIVSRLIAAGADLESTDAESRTALSHAAAKGHREVLVQLVKAGAEVETKDTRDWTPLYSAVCAGDAECVRILIQAGCDVNTRSPIRTGLQEAVRRGHHGVVKVLLAAGVRVQDTTAEESPVFEAARNGHVGIYRTLMLCSDDVTMMDRHGKRALHYMPFYGVVSYDVIDEIGKMPTKLIQLGPNEMPDVSSVSKLDTLFEEPGTGSTDFLPQHYGKCVYDDVGQKLATATGGLLERLSLSWVEYGSVTEGTKTGLPDEVNYMILMEKFEEGTVHIQDIGCGFKHCISKVAVPPSYRESMITEGGHVFRGYFQGLLLEELDKNAVESVDLCCVPHMAGEGDTPLYFRWKDTNDTVGLSVLVDLVYAIQVHGWPQDGRESTWLMDKKALTDHGYQLVAKPPNRGSKIAKTYQPAAVRRLWMTSFARLEAHHISQLAPDIKNILITAKCLRKPEVCRMMFQDSLGQLHTVETFISTYMLKTIFLHRVEEYLHIERHLPLGFKVLRIYEELEKSLSDGFLASFWQPTVNILDNIRLDVSQVLQVVKIMTRFVGALCERDVTATSHGELCGGYYVYRLGL